MKKEGAAWHPPLYHSITLSLQKSKPLFLPLPVKTASAKETHLLTPGIVPKEIHIPVLFIFPISQIFTLPPHA